MASSPAWSQVAEAQPRLATFESSTGEKYFALSLVPSANVTAAAAQDVVILYDTSASQTGIYRDDSMAALQSMLGSLGAQDRVKLMAVDLSAIPLTQQFVAPGSDEVAQALRNLDQRAPLGSTDMLGAMRGALSSFEGPAARPRAVVYIGDGMSRAKVVESPGFESLIRDLVAARVAVSSLAIGPNRDAHLLAALANHTGGMLYVDAESNTAQEAGLAMARAARATVFWPLHAKLPPAFQEAYPKQMPPLRADRDSILIGRLDGAGPYDVSVHCEANGREVDQSWQLASEASNPDFGFLPQLVATARADAGLKLPTVGSAGLREVAALMAKNAAQLAELGGHALRTGDLAGASTAAEAAIASDPGNPQAVAVQGAVNRYSQGGGGDEDLRLINLQDPAPANALSRELGGDAGALLNTVEAAKRVRTEAVQAEVEAALTEARNKTGSAPTHAIQDLKVLLERIESDPDLDAEVRSQLTQRIQAAIRDAGRILVEVENHLAHAEENRAAGLEAERLISETERRRQKVKQLLDRFNALLDEGQYYSAEVDVAEQVELIARQQPYLTSAAVTGIVARWNARNLKNVRDMMRFRDLRHRNFVDAMYQVEKSAIPFPDEPPIVYPDAQVWEDLSMRRKKFATIDLAGQSQSEQRIAQALDREMKPWDYLDQPLKDVIDDIAFNENIPIVLNAKALEDLGVDTSQPITRNLKGITLRSGLRLLLKELELTYIIKDEVLQITTLDDADAQLITKVYPVGDLVIPVISGGGGFGIGGGGGGFGGGGIGGGGGGFGGGGFGGGGGGFGGGGFGGGGFGGGGGFFAVDDELKLGAKDDTQAPPAPSQDAAPKPKTTEPVGAIQLQRRANESLFEAWNRHFAEHRNDSAAAGLIHAKQVRETVRRLQADAEVQLNRDNHAAAKSRLDEIVALIQAALRNNQPQPWMYEAMSLAMLAGDAPVEEVERALMSGVDFSQNDDEIFHVASYMARLGLEQRSLKLYQDLAASNPMRPEPFVKGLELAEQTNDEEALRWACVGILNQAWERELQEIEQRATRHAKSLLLKMQQEKRTEEADQFLAELNKAIARDCVVRVTWTGDADVDLLVEEPTATVCSSQNPRTTSGGVMLGDAFARDGGKSLDGFSEVYICPQGYSGKYRLLLRNVWGKVTADKVTVEIWTNYGSESQTYGKQQIPLGERDAIVNFELKEGRRVEPLEEEKIAKIDRQRLDMGQAILAQQLAGLGDSSSLTDYALSIRRAMASGVVDPRIFGRRGAVGFRPQIQIFPEGNQMDSLAIIDASRRYVRFTMLGTAPIASGITNVDTFNFVTGQGGQQGGGGGIGGGGGGFGGGGFGGGGGFF